MTADNSRHYPHSVRFPQPSEAAWLAQTYGGAVKDYEGEFENRVNKINNSHDMPTPGEKQETLPMRRPSMRKMVAQHVITLFNKDGKADGAKRRHVGASKDNKEGTRNRRPEIPPLSLDGTGDESNLDNSCSANVVVIDCINTSPTLYSHIDDNNRLADTIDNVHSRHAASLEHAAPSLVPPTLRPLTSTLSSGPSSKTSSKASFPPHSSFSTAQSSTSHSTPSSMQEFRGTTRELLSQASRANTSSGMRTRLTPLDPAKFDPVGLGITREPGDM